MFEQFRHLWGASFLLLSVTTVQAEKTDQTFCRYYARDLISMPKKKQHKVRMCRTDQAHWKGDKASHIKWCLSVSRAEANKRRYSHNKLVNLCDDVYKLIMIDRHRLANLLLDTNEKVKLPLANKQLRQALWQGNSNNPYAQFYPIVNQAVKNKYLDQCDVYSLSVDVDSNSVSREWILVVDESCFPEKKMGHVWLLQQLKNAYYVLFEGEDNTLTLHYKTYNGYKNITINTRLRINEESEKRCGSIRAEWHYVKGRYLPFKGEANEQGNCLPAYHLPDYLQGENIFTLSEKAWQDGMKREEKRRISLFAPYKKALEAYIPQWIENMEQRVPAMQELVGAVPFVSTPRQEKKEKVETKGFIQTIRDFLGFSS